MPDHDPTRHILQERALVARSGSLERAVSCGPVVQEKKIKKKFVHMIVQKGEGGVGGDRGT